MNIISTLIHHALFEGRGRIVWRQMSPAVDEQRQALLAVTTRMG